MGGGGHIHPYALHFQNGEKFFQTRLGPDLAGIKRLHSLNDLVDDLLLGPRQTADLPQIGDHVAVR